MKEFCRKGHMKGSGKRWLAILMSICLIGTMIPISARAENGTTNTGLCEHHTEHTAECGYAAPVEGHACEHEHDDSCGYQEAGDCNHVHTEECGEDGENCTHVHDDECGYAEGYECEHVHDDECGYVEASEGSPCTFVCDICGNGTKPGENNLSDETLMQTLEQIEGKLIAAEPDRVVSSNILSDYNTSFEGGDNAGHLYCWKDASWEPVHIPRRAYGEAAAKPAADCGDYYVQANPANIGDKAQCQIAGGEIAALIKGGKTYEYSYYAKLAEGEPAGGVTLSVIGDWSTGAVITPDKEVTLNADEWQKVTGTFTLASDASNVVVRFEGTANVSFCLDDLRVAEVVEDPTPDPEPDPTPNPIPDPTPDPEPDPTPKPTPNPIPDPIPNPIPDPIPDPTPDPTSDPTPEPEPDLIPNPSPGNENGNKPGSKPVTNTEVTTEAPFIKGENGKEGWDVIRDEVNQTQEGKTITVDMNGSTVVPGDVLDEIKGKDITIVFDMGNGITWSVNGQSITADRVSDIDFTVKTGTNTIPVDIINNVTGERYSQQISLAYDGEFGFTAVLSINVDAKNAGLYANLFYYNEKTGEMEFICYDEIAADGTAELVFTHASDYAIVIDTEPMDKGADEADGDKTDLSETGNESTQSGDGCTQTGTEAADSTWNPLWLLLIGAVVIVIGLGVFLEMKKKKPEDK